jgi:hypothetical protein
MHSHTVTYGIEMTKGNQRMAIIRTDEANKIQASSISIHSTHHAQCCLLSQHLKLPSFKSSQVKSQITADSDVTCSFGRFPDCRRLRRKPSHSRAARRQVPSDYREEDILKMR